MALKHYVCMAAIERRRSVSLRLPAHVREREKPKLRDNGRLGRLWIQLANYIDLESLECHTMSNC